MAIFAMDGGIGYHVSSGSSYDILRRISSTMPLYEYACRGCGSLVELLVRDQETPACTACGSEKLQRQLSVIAAHVGRGQSDFQPCEAPSPGSIPGGCGLPQCGTGGCQFG